MGKFIDLAGKKVGRLTIIRRLGTSYGTKSKHVKWVCLCECGVQKVIERPGYQTMSCGCKTKDAARDRGILKTRENGAPTPEYTALRNCIARCIDPEHPSWKHYGGRGIAVCDRWSKPGGYAYFLADMGKRPSSAHSLDRYPNNDGNYEPGNCRWALQIEQVHNRRKIGMLCDFSDAEIRTEFMARGLTS